MNSNGLFIELLRFRGGSFSPEYVVSGYIPVIGGVYDEGLIEDALPFHFSNLPFPTLRLCGFA